jgi:hypothetical protein
MLLAGSCDESGNSRNDRVRFDRTDPPSRQHLARGKLATSSDRCRPPGTRDGDMVGAGGKDVSESRPPGTSEG